MNIHELVLCLSEASYQTEVFVSSDEEGNQISTLNEVTDEWMNEHGEIVHENDVSEYAKGELRMVKVLWP